MGGTAQAKVKARMNSIMQEEASEMVKMKDGENGGNKTRESVSGDVDM